MKKFMVVYYAPSETAKKMDGATPEQMEEGMKPWMEWAGRVGDKMVDLGTPLGNGKKVTKSGVSNSQKEVNGYSILQAESIDEAVKLLENHPHLNWAEGCEIEVYESLPLPRMG